MLIIATQRLLKYSAKGLINLGNRVGLKCLQSTDELYFGYGANLGVERFQKLGIEAEVIGIGRLEEYKLTFGLPCEYLGKGYADISKEVGSEVWGTLFKINKVGLKLLDILEWVPFSFYKRIKVTIEVNENQYEDCWIYKACSPREGLVPSNMYKKYILEKSKEFNFPESYINNLTETSSQETFSLDTAFRLSNPGKKRWGAVRFQKIYLLHDQLREKFSELLP